MAKQAKGEVMDVHTPRKRKYGINKAQRMKEHLECCVRQRKKCLCLSIQCLCVPNRMTKESTSNDCERGRFGTEGTTEDFRLVDMVLVRL
jgi:hypothetical protein